MHSPRSGNPRLRHAPERAVRSRQLGQAALHNIEGAASNRGDALRDADPRQIPPDQADARPPAAARNVPADPQRITASIVMPRPDSGAAARSGVSVSKHRLHPDRGEEAVMVDLCRRAVLL
jgi:hypothetical protein